MESDFFASVYSGEGESADHHGSRTVVHARAAGINVLSSRKCRTGLRAKNLAKRKRAKSGARGYKLLPGPQRYIAPGRRAFTAPRRFYTPTLNARRTYFQLFIAPAAACFSHGALYLRGDVKKKCVIAAVFGWLITRSRAYVSRWL